ncbi:translation initiation factor eIF-2B subunit epsilon-like [Anopheles ziemanni]|uniref:translation initiation factor eIF-2B subunit epsilon-like n=1 Tax=Anopheles coustani TaxID=139045 RepID=UPI00265B0385|nr:translation initiation factor eIF-2B subunit epsilon-like [Anopheles coustani]XP_058175913.1 translation initiation factor eIF-2B subunit epsilon-like [Anopheles ziemanni]
MSKSIENEEIVQAILIADSYNDNFLPFTSACPLALLPLVNVPLIEYTLEVLNRHGVEEVIVFCSNQSNEVKRFIHQRQAEKCTWSMNMIITTISSESCRCLGEALRDLEARHIIRGNVILLGVDSVTNANLTSLLEEHKRLLKLDRGAAMTVVYKDTVQGLRTGNEVMIVTDSSTRRLLYHQRLTQQQQQRERNFELPLELFVANRNVTVSHGLLDPQIAICSHAALPLFADNFDFLSRDDFVNGVLINEEILNSRIYVAKLGREEYAMRVSNWQTYHMVSLDVMNRWVYPLVPDMAISQVCPYYKYYRNNIYRHRNVGLSRSCELDGDLVVAENSTIEEDTSIRQSVVGRGCKIGRKCRIRNSFLFDGATVGDNCVLDHCVIASGASVGAGCHISDGAVLGERVELPGGMTVAKVLIQADKPDDEWGGASQKLAERAYTVPEEQPDEDEDEDEDVEVREMFNQPLPIAPLRSVYSPSIYQLSDDEGPSGAPSPVQEDSSIFLSEVVESLKRGLAEQTNAEYLILEINSSRYAYNMSLGEVNFYMVKAILQILVVQEGVATNAVGTLRKLLAYFGIVFHNYIRDKDAMLDCLKAFEEMCQSNEIIRAKIVQLLHFLYEGDLVSEEVIIRWYDGVEDETLKSTLAKFVQWLNESSDDESDDED